LLSKERAFELFDSLLEDRRVSIVLLVSSFVGLLISLSFDWGRFVTVFDAFERIDLYKISLFAGGFSSYSSNSLFEAPYPPFYFIVWAGPYLAFAEVFHFSLNQTFFAVRSLSAILSALCGTLIYRQATFQGFSKIKSCSLASIFVLCSIVGLIALTGDFFGLIFLSIGCLFLIRRRMNLGLVFCSLSVAFKVQPILGLLLLVVSPFLISIRNNRKYDSIQYLTTVAAVGTLLVIVPLAFISNATSSFLIYGLSHIEYYSFNIYGGLSGVLLNLFPMVPTASIIEGIDAIWIATSVALVVVFLRSLIKKDASLLLRANPVDLLSLGILLWLIILKQTMPHYFIWVLLPLLARGRTRTVLYVLGAEFFGMLFFGVAYLFPLSTSYVGLPGIDSSFAFLTGGILFTFFMALGLVNLLVMLRRESLESLMKDRETQHALRSMLTREN
jgi:hypothetical protein